MKELFEQTKAAGWTWEELSEKVETKSGRKIPPSTLKFWSYGYSTPKVDELDDIAAAFDLELELLGPK